MRWSVGLQNILTWWFISNGMVHSWNRTVAVYLNKILLPFSEQRKEVVWSSYKRMAARPENSRRATTLPDCSSRTAAGRSSRTAAGCGDRTAAGCSGSGSEPQQWERSDKTELQKQEHKTGWNQQEIGSTTGQEELSSLPRMDEDFVDIVRRKTNYILFYLLVVANRFFSVSCVNT